MAEVNQSPADRRSPSRWVLPYAVVISLVGALVFGLLSGFTHKVSGSASIDPALAAEYQVGAAAIELAVTPAIHVTGSFSSDTGERVGLDAQVSNEGSMVATLTLLGEEAEFVATGQRRFVLAGADLWSRLGASEADATLYGGQWVQVDNDFLGTDLPAVLAPQRLAWVIADPDLTQLTGAPGAVEQVNGVPARPIRTGEVTVWISQDEPKRIVRVRTAEQRQQGDLVGRPPAEEPGPDGDDDVIEVPDAGDGPELPGLDVDLTDLTDDQIQELFEQLLPERVRALTESIDSRVTFTLSGAIALSPCGPNGCMATVNFSNTVTSTSPYLTASLPVNVKVTTTMTLDGVLVQTCENTLTMPPNGGASTQCFAAYTILPVPNPRQHTVNARAVLQARAVIQTDIDAMLTDLAEEQRRGLEFIADPLVPGGGLPRHEATRDRDGGHTILTHLGRTDADLLARLQGPRPPPAASTWSDLSVADRTVAATLAANERRIQAWLKDAAARTRPLELDFAAVSGQVTGRYVSVELPTVQEVGGARVVLKWSPSSPTGLGYFILTSFPQL